jgi:hypothetical protein
MLKRKNLELEKGRKLETETLRGERSTLGSGAWFYNGGILREKRLDFKVEADW